MDVVLEERAISMHKPQIIKKPDKNVIAKLTIPSGYVGPTGIANGGYVCGLMANFIDGPADVFIRMPAAVEHEMPVVAPGDGNYYLMDGEKVVVQAKAASLDLEVPKPPIMKWPLRRRRPQSL